MSCSAIQCLTFFYFLSLVIMSIVTVTQPYLQQTNQFEMNNTSEEIDLSPAWKLGVVINQFLVLFIGKLSLPTNIHTHVLLKVRIVQNNV